MSGIVGVGRGRVKLVSESGISKVERGKEVVFVAQRGEWVAKE